MKNSYCQEDIDILRLIRSENIGSRIYQQLMRVFSSPKDALANIKDFATRGGRNKPLKICSQNDALKEIEELNKNDCGFITYKSPNYPKLLAEIPNFPIVLTYKGRLSLLRKERIIAVVGSRNCSINGKIFTKKIVEDLLSENFTIISGLALGIDTQAHQSSIENTIAVLAGGIDHIYPFANKRLFDEIAEKSIVITEAPFGTKAVGKNFPQRNRIISGTALASVIIEANIKSGSLITARLALEQNREVFAVPGFPLDTRSSGTNKLIKESQAFLTESIDDIANKIQIEKNLEEVPKPELLTNIEFSRMQTKEYKKNRDKIISMLTSTAVSYEDIHRETGIPMKIVSTICLELSINGIIHLDELSNRVSIIHSQ